MILALLGDNPMQSEFACHVGLTGKFFCRACWVKGKDAHANNAAAAEASAKEGGEGDDEASSNAGSVGSDTSAPDAKDQKKATKSAHETLGIMVDRVTAFIKVGCSIRLKTIPNIDFAVTACRKESHVEKKRPPRN